ncbi:YlzJ-like family protein [Aquibacillus salsiterrae]|uniref:YlzJ-like family protein n=1 Tax=Aquibacillus salsiterrae TaxID=2950439 RepID=A0A9X3WF89_9BACI|nr:YlzJ-like family protein [Aquibacillus salsiterrae]MDC3416344.1 YlzJ-like family protein [Aquibacillus salsiterrae]
MILYTPLSEFDIFPTDQASYTNRQMIDVDEMTVEIEHIEQGSYRITQLLSTNPQHFLNQSLTPGTTFQLY